MIPRSINAPKRAVLYITRTLHKFIAGVQDHLGEKTILGLEGVPSFPSRVDVLSSAVRATFFEQVEGFSGANGKNFVCSLLVATKSADKGITLKQKRIQKQSVH